MFDDLVGQSYTFEDGNSITVTQIKRRDGEEYWVTFQVVTGPGIPRRQVMEYHEFMHTYGHLFKI
jgi:hypothetical protein